MPQIRVLTLGRFSVAVDGTEMPALSSQPVRAALLVYLVIERNVTRDAAIGCIWPDQPNDRARHALSQTLYQLRRDLGSGWVTASGAYLRCSENVTADAVDFAVAAESGRWQDAIELYDGAFLDACFLVASSAFQQWTDRTSARLAGLHRRARTCRIEELTARGDHAAVVQCAHDWLRSTPLDDEATQALMRGLHMSGDRAAALRQYETFARLLAREGDEPSVETTALAEEIGSVRALHAPTPTETIAAAARQVPTPGPPVVRTPTGVDRLVSRGRRSVPRGRRLAAIVAGAVLTLAMIIILAVRTGDPPDAKPIRSVAILPNANTEAYGVPEYFAEGVQSGLIAGLARSSDLRILSGTAAAAARSTLPAAIARELGVDGVITTAIRHSADSVRVEASLTDAAGRVVASAEGVRPLTETPDLLADVAASLANQLAGASDANTRAPLPPVDRTAFDRYLQAEHLVRDLRMENWLAAAALYESAIDADTSFGPAYAGVALTQFAAGLFGTAPRSTAWPRARAWANRAVARDSALAGAHTVLGFIALFDDWEWAVAEKELLRALRLDRNDIMARHAYADLLTLRGEAEAGLHQIELARSIDPLSPLTNGPMLGHLYFAHRFQDVVDSVPAMRRRFERPDFAASFLAPSLWYLGQRDEALDEFRTAHGWRTDAALSRSLEQGYEAGGPSSALRAAADLEARRWTPGDGSAFEIARLYGHAGATAEALVWLERAYEERPPDFIHFTTDPAFAQLHSSPRFASLLKRVGIDPVTSVPVASR